MPAASSVRLIWITSALLMPKGVRPSTVRMSRRLRPMFLCKIDHFCRAMGRVSSPITERARREGSGRKAPH